MAQWPPSPSVEDEHTALANEHSLAESIESLKSDNQGALSRGSIDQNPILIDTAEAEVQRLEKKEARKHKTNEHFSSDINSSDDSAGPPTPPPILRKEERKPYRANTVDYSSAKPQLPVRGRPPVTRLQTDIENNVPTITSGNRRPPSPYAYSRAQTFNESGSSHLTQTPTFLSPRVDYGDQPTPQDRTHRQPSLVNTREALPPMKQPSDERGPQISYARSRSEYRPGQSTRRLSQNVRSDPRQCADAELPRGVNACEARRISREINDNGRDTYLNSPSQSRRQSKESSSGTSEDERKSKQRPAYPRSVTRDMRDSPYTSAAEEAARARPRRSDQGSGDEHKRLRRKSSHRHTRPLRIEVSNDTRSESVPASAIDGPEARNYRQGPRTPGQSRPLTPPPPGASKAAVEDYLARAFQENESRKPPRSFNPRSSGSSVVSPMATPPRSPRTERQGTGYFDLAPSAPRPAQRSRPPSIDESQLKDPKAYSNLLSAATAGAAYAARSLGSGSKSSAQSTEVGSTAATSRHPSAPRSKKTSPANELYEEPQNVMMNPGDQRRLSRVPFTPNHDPKPVSRGSLYVAEQDYFQPQPQPKRASSFSALDQGLPPTEPYPLSTANGTSAHGQSQPRSARSSMNPAELPIPAKDGFILPSCPRSQPTAGHRDWWTIKENSNIDICPTCMGAIGTTRYRNLFVRSLPRPYDEPSVCAMSKPWVRLAFLMSLRQNRPDLDAIRAVTRLPKDVRPCAGNKTDIRKWYHVIDPLTKEPIPDFAACTECVRAVDKVFPDICTVFERPKSQLNKESNCHLHVGSKHFQSIMDHLTHADIRCQGREWRPVDIEPLVCHLRRVARYQSCPRDKMTASRSWHFMPDLPEFTICEECYDEVVRPVSDRSVARDVTKSLKVVPLRRGSNGTSGISCQLYSDRMRKHFRDAVEFKDIAPLHEAVKTRVSAQQRLSEINKLYEQDLRCGIDRHQEIQKNHAIWRKFE